MERGIDVGTAGEVSDLPFEPGPDDGGGSSLSSIVRSLLMILLEVIVALGQTRALERGEWNNGMSMTLARNWTIAARSHGHEPTRNSRFSAWSAI